MSTESNELENELEQTEVETTDELTETTETTTEAVVEETEKAKSYGHKSLEEFVAAGGDPKDYKTAKEFNLTGEVIELKKTLQKRDKDIEEILKYQQQVIENHKLQMRQRLTEELAQAKAIGDVDAVEKLTEAKHRQDATQEQERFTKLNEERRQVDEAFLERNSTWYNVPELKARSIDISNRVTALNPQITYPQLLREIEDQMKYELSSKPEFAKFATLTTDSSRVPRPNLSPGQSAVARSAIGDNTDASQFSKLTSNQKNMFNVLKRVAEKAQAKKDPKDVKPYTVSQFLKAMKKDEDLE